MAERNSDKYVQFVASQNRPSSTSKVKMPKRTEVKLRAKSACGPQRKQANDFFAKEEEYKLLNAKLEAKTADLVRQAEQLVKQQNEALSKPLSTCLLSDLEEEAARRVSSLSSMDEPQEMGETKRPVTLKGKSTGNQRQEPEAACLNPEAHLLDDDSVDAFLAKTLRCIEEKMNDTLAQDATDDVQSAGDNDGISTAQVRVLKAKIRLMQQEQDQVSCEYHKKDDENAKLNAKIKEIEEDRARQQKTVTIQQTQIEKHKALGEESARKCNSLQTQVSALQKEIENLNRSHKQATTVHGTVEVRLSRALEEVEKLKTQIKKMKQMNQDKMNEEHQSKENLLAENRMLKKQKAELIEGFKKQLKLIDILKRQKMHFEAAKLLSFTEEEFMKALDWGKP